MLLTTYTARMIRTLILAAAITLVMSSHAEAQAIGARFAAAMRELC